MKNVWNFCLFLVLSIFIGCKRDVTYKDASQFIRQLNEQSGCCYGLKKTNTYRGDGWIVLHDKKGWYQAINLKDFEESGYSNEYNYFMDQKIQVFPSASYHGTYTDSKGNLYEEKNQVIKDLEKVGSFVESLNHQKMTENLVLAFGLSEKRAFEVSKLLLNWNKISNKRRLNTRDLDHFSKNLLGESFQNVKKVLMDHANGKNEVYEAFINKAANKNQVDPENMKEIFNSLQF